MDEVRRVCPNCGGSVTGRTDKRFCCDECRTMFHNRLYRNKRKEIDRIDRILKKNRSIIERLYNSGERKVTVRRLYRMGFNFRYITSLVEDPDSTGKYLVGCYDYSCSLTSDGRVSIMHGTPILP